jgi:hypothetical protein
MSLIEGKADDMLNVSSSHVDPKRTLVSISCCSNEVSFGLFQNPDLSRYDAVS